MTIVLHLVFLMLYKRIVVNWQAIQVTKRRVRTLTNVGKAMVCHRLRRGFRDHATPSGGAHYVERFCCGRPCTDRLCCAVLLQWPL